MTAVNHALAFALELALLAVLAAFGWSLGDGAVARAGYAILLAGGAAALWGFLAAPKSPRRLAGWPLGLFKLGMFGAGAAALAGLGHPAAALVFAALALGHVALAARLGSL